MKTSWIRGACVALLTGCSSAEAPTAAGFGGAAEGPLYVVQQNVNGPDGRIVYFNVFSSLDSPGDAIAPENGVELHGYSTVRAYDGAIFTAEEETRTITRWAVDANGGVRPTGKLSLANEVLDTFWNENFLFVSPTRAYYANAGAAEILVWDPSRMELTGRITLPDLVKPGLTLGFGGLTRIGSRVLMPIRWGNWDTNEVYPHMVLAILSPEEDRVLGILEDTRCGVPVSNLPDLGTTSDGTYHLVGDAWYSSFRYFGTPTPAPSCVLRVRPDAQGFDPDWTESLNGDLEGHGEMSTLVIDEPRGYVYSQLLKPPTQTFSSMDDVWTYLDRNTTKVRCSLGTWADCEPLPLEGNPHWFVTRIDGEVLMTSLLGDASDCVVYRMEAGGPRRLFQTQGFISSLERVR